MLELVLLSSVISEVNHLCIRSRKIVSMAKAAVGAESGHRPSVIDDR